MANYNCRSTKSVSILKLTKWHANIRVMLTKMANKGDPQMAKNRSFCSDKCLLEKNNNNNNTTACFLAHLSQRLIGEFIVYPWSGVRLSLSSFVIVHNAQTSSLKRLQGQSKPNFMWVGGTKVCLRHLGHMTKMAAMPIYGKNPLKIFFSRTRGLISMKLGVKHRGLLPIIVCSNDDPGVTLTYFTARSNFVTKAFP